MADDQSTTAINPADEPIKSSADLRIEKLESELEALKSRYDTELTEARKANRELWAALHPAPEDPPSVPVPDAQPEKTAEDFLMDALGGR